MPQDTSATFLATWTRFDPQHPVLVVTHNDADGLSAGAANYGYQRDWVHFAARSATGRNLIDFLREVAPPHADENYGSGHEQATGGALRVADWPLFLRNIGFD